MNILFFYESIDLGGQQTYNYNLVKRFSQRSHQTSYVYLYGHGMQDKMQKYADLHNLDISLTGKDYLFKPWRVMAIVKKLLNRIKTDNSQVIISASGIGSLICGIAARLSGIAHFRIMGCSLIQVEPTLYKLYKVIGIDKLIDGYFGWPAAFHELHDKGVSLDKCYNLQPAVDTDTFFPQDKVQRQSFRTTLGINDDDVVIGWVGRIAQNMQVGNTVELGKALKERGMQNLKLLLVGGGDWLSELQSIVRDYDMQDLVIFTDWVHMDEVNNYLNAMDIVPLLERDPQGGSILREAIAAGVITVSVDGPSKSQSEFMQPDFSVLVGEHEFVEKAADAVDSLVANTTALENMSERARNYALKYMSFDIVVDTVFEAIRQQHKMRKS